MSFLTRIGFIETEEQERERLAQAPEGSINHHLSTLPVTISEWPRNLLVQLPWDPPRTSQQYTVVVVPITFSKDTLPQGAEEKPLPRRRHSGHWECAVVSSDHPRYPVGGHNLSVSAAELARGTRIDLSACAALLLCRSEHPPTEIR